MSHIQMLSIRSRHVDFFCRRCSTAFELKEGDYVTCPKCDVSSPLHEFELEATPIPEPPKPPEARKWCPVCGFLKDGQHTNLLCVIAERLEKKKKL